MTQTHASAPIFPPGRYGRRRRARRTPGWMVGVLVAAVVAAGLGVAWRLYQQYGDPAYDVSVIRVDEITGTGVTVEFAVNVPPGGSATCVVRARAYSGEQVGRAEVTVTAEPGRRRVVTRYRLATSAQPFTGEVTRCRPPGG
ncbi:MAG TPA: DUF4307 domain-containing protein [Micromonosporaceae bacterium]|nr:DUF4307 domain-containing protein [Micromonosporaceae bacterium]